MRYERTLTPAAATLAVAALLAVPAAAAAQSAAPPYAVGPPLTEPPELCPTGEGQISVTFNVREADVPVQVLDTDNELRTRELTLRSWQLSPGGSFTVCPGSEAPATDQPLIPGPTFRLRKSPQGTTDGTRFNLLLANELPVLARSPYECNPVHDIPRNGSVPIRPDQACDSGAFPAVAATFPECFHGDNTTNLHYHGFHISPQAPQDWVLLALQPKGASCPEGDPTCRVGEFQFRLDPIPDNQAEGTHWYHPHKHGSTALQVLNGMSGTFVIEGPFDDWLNGFYEGGLEDKVLVVQQIHDGTNFFHENDTQFTKGCKEEADGMTKVSRGDCSSCPDACVCQATSFYAPPQPAVNGDINPVVTMKSGEVQRWRFVGATMQASAQIEIGFPLESEAAGGFVVKQIAQDGVQFAPANYGKQPLLSEDRENGRVETNLNLAPGNRVDLLVKAPEVEEETLFFLTHELFGQVDPTIRGLMEERGEVMARRMDAAMKEEQKLQAPPLLSVRVLAEDDDMALPTQAQWPPLPAFLRDIDSVQGSRTVPFQLRGRVAQPSNDFYIDDAQYCPSCAQYTTTRGQAEEWTVTNTYDPNPGGPAPRHPFHIHINPFQLRSAEYWVLVDDCDTTDPQCVQQGSTCLPEPKRCTETFDPPIWMDVVALPPTITLKDDETVKDGQVVLRQRYEDFTGEFVIHCHFLGHEDRGMMLNVQTVCEGKPEPLFGEPEPGVADDCTVTEPAAPACSGPCDLAGHGGHGGG